jgi:hypothetical protein
MESFKKSSIQHRWDEHFDGFEGGGKKWKIIHSFERNNELFFGLLMMMI